MRAGWSFPGAHQVPPGQFPEGSRPLLAPFSRSLRETEAKSRQRLTDRPTHLPQASPQKQRASPAGTAPLPQECSPGALPWGCPWCPLTVLAGEGAVLAARGTCGGRQAVISVPNPALQSAASAEEMFTQLEELGEEWRCHHCPCASSNPPPTPEG